MGLNPANIGRTLEGIGRRLRLLVDRAVVRIVTDSLGRQNLQIQSLADSTNDDVERFQNYGLTSVPPVGSEALILAVGGRREGLVAIAVEDKRCRPKGLEDGEVRLYHGDGQSYITLKKGGLPGVESIGLTGTGGIIGGSDIEPVSELLDRLLFRKRNPPVGGAVHDYVIWAREMAGVSRAWAFDAWHGPCTIGLAWVYDDRSVITPGYQDRKNMEDYLFRHTDPATGVWVGKPGGIEVWPVELVLRPVNMIIGITPDTPATRKAVQSRLLTLQKTLQPGQTLPISAIRTAIGTASGVTDYTLNLTADIPCAQNELITIGVLTWPTV